jgi:hypothetical protein
MKDSIPEIALSIRQPWASLVVLGFKPLENRNWRTTFRGRFAIHAAKGCTTAEYQAAMEFALAINPDLPNETFAYPNLQRGGLIGEVTLTDCVSQSASPWFTGKYGFLMEAPIAYDQIIPCAGLPGFFRPNLIL